VSIGPDGRPRDGLCAGGALGGGEAKAEAFTRRHLRAEIVEGYRLKVPNFPILLMPVTKIELLDCFHSSLNIEVGQVFR
jgi:hypothetical protein